MYLYFYIVCSYLLGGIPFGLIIGYLTGNGNIRQKGSGNIGATNVWRIAGPGAALFVFIGDIGKGAVPVLLSSWFYNPNWPLSYEAFTLTAGFIAVVGHMFSPFLKFKGGKGVNTALGVFICLVPVETLAAIVVFLLIVLITRFISLGSIAGCIFLAGLLWIEKIVFARPIANEYLLAISTAAILIVAAHHGNIRRLLKGSENRFQLGKARD